jgi:tRNA (adenine37-N6)-methyltransferase
MYAATVAARSFSMGDNMQNSAEEVVLRPLGMVRGGRVEPTDDDWGEVVSAIELDDGVLSEQSILGLCDFSHLEVVFLLHRVDPKDVETAARHPRNRQDYPLTGVLAQRAKRRPNRIAVSRCELLAVEGLRLTVRGLDAIDGSPVLDVKPYFREFGPRGPVRQPDWATELMAKYY